MAGDGGKLGGGGVRFWFCFCGAVRYWHTCWFAVGLAGWERPPAAKRAAVPRIVQSNVSVRPFACAVRKRALVVGHGFLVSLGDVRHVGIHRAGALSEHVPFMYLFPSLSTRRE